MGDFVLWDNNGKNDKPKRSLWLTGVMCTLLD